MERSSTDESADRVTAQNPAHPLTDLLPHDCCIVMEVLAQDNDVQRLMSMGVCVGRTIEVVKNGDPLILKVFGSRIGVSARLAERVQVTPCSPGTY